MASPFKTNDLLVAGLIASDKFAIEYFFRRYFHGLKLYVDNDEDIAMEAFEIALEKIGSYDPAKGKFITWVYRIARNLFLKGIKATQKENTVYAEEILENYNEEDTGGDDREEWVQPNSYNLEEYRNFFQEKFIDVESERHIHQALRMLSTTERKVLRDYCQSKITINKELKKIIKKLRVIYYSLTNS